MKANAEVLEDLCEQSVGPPVQVVGRDNLITRFKQLDHRIYGRKATGKSQTILPALYTGKGIFQSLSRRVVSSGILKSLMASGCALGISGCLIDGRHYGSVCRVVRLTPVYGLGVEFHPENWRFKA